MAAGVELTLFFPTSRDEADLIIANGFTPKQGIIGDAVYFFESKKKVCFKMIIFNSSHI